MDIETELTHLTNKLVPFLGGTRHFQGFIPRIEVRILITGRSGGGVMVHENGPGRLSEAAGMEPGSVLGALTPQQFGID